ncbi:MAG: alpha-E domain-containing protein [Opitutaceae bacterium]
MLSRVANLTYWMARYLERADNSARILDVNTQLALENRAGPSDDARLWQPIIFALGDETLFKQLYPETTEQSVAEFVLFNTKNPNSILSCINLARENARCIRDQLSSEAWEQLNRLYLHMRDKTVADYHGVGTTDFLSRLRKSIQLFYGIAASMLPRNDGWHFYNLGRFLERADNTSRVIDVKYFTLLPSALAVGSALDALHWAAVLRSCSAFEAFRKSRLGVIKAERVLEYLILDEFFPRSIRFSIITAEEAVRRLTRDADHHYSNAPSRSLGRLRADLDYLLIGDIVSHGLHEWIDNLQLKIAKIHEDIESAFVDYDIERARILG